MNAVCTHFTRISAATAHGHSRRAASSNVERLDAFLNERIGDASTPENLRYWSIKRDFKRGLDPVDDEKAERLAGLLLDELGAQVQVGAPTGRAS
jgi:hypothetical protein